MKVPGKQRETIELVLWEESVEDGSDRTPHKVVATIADLTPKDVHEIGKRSRRLTWDKSLNDGKGGAVVDQHHVFLTIMRETLRIQVPSVRGLTVEALQEIANHPPHVDLDVPELDEHGFIPWDHDAIVFAEEEIEADPIEADPNRVKRIRYEYSLPMFLVRYAPKQNFKDKIDEVQREMKRLRAEVEKKSSRTSAS